MYLHAHAYCTQTDPGTEKLNNNKSRDQDSAASSCHGEGSLTLPCARNLGLSSLVDPRSNALVLKLPAAVKDPRGASPEFIADTPVETICRECNRTKEGWLYRADLAVRALDAGGLGPG